MVTTVKDLELKVDLLTTTVNTLIESISTFNKTGNRRLDAALEVKITSLDIEQAIKYKFLDGIKDNIDVVLRSNRASAIEPIIMEAFRVNKPTILEAVNNAIAEQFNELNLKPLVKEAFSNKIAKSILSGIDGTIDLMFTDLRKDPVFNAKLVILINNFVTDYKNEIN
jgi:hypothetical protein